MAASVSALLLGSPPIPRTRLIGREAERATARAYLLDEAVPLLTLTGPGGVGKTRLALAIATDVANHFADGIVWVDLAPLADPALVPITLAAALGIAPAPGTPIAKVLARHLRSRQMLLLLDNCEHVLVDTAELVAPLLAVSPALQVLATSRVPLHLRGEQVLPVEPLPIPDAGVTSVSALLDSAAVQLFVDRATAGAPHFSLTPANAAAVAAICCQLDGVPLAIELVAARMPAFSPAHLLDQLADGQYLRLRGPRDLPARQQTLQAAMGWSHDLLTPQEQALFRRFAVFAGGFTLEAASAVANARDASGNATADGIAALVDHSLLRRRDAPGGTSRHRMLEPIREYALARLAASGEQDAAQHAHAAYFLALAEASVPHFGGPAEADWLTRLEDDHHNLRAALSWATARGAAETALRLSGALWDFWYTRGYLREGRHWLEAALIGSEHVTLPVRARGLLAAGQLAHFLGDPARARARLAESLALYRSLSDARGVGTTLLVLGVMAEDAGAYEQADIAFAEAHARLAEAGVPATQGLVRCHQGIVAYGRGDIALAETNLAEALQLAQHHEDGFGIALALLYLGLLASERHDPVAAASALAEALRLAQEHSDQEAIARVLATVAVLASASAQFERAAHLLGAAEAVREHIGLLPFALPEGQAYQHAEATARARLGAAAYAATWAMGKATPIDETLANVASMLRLMLEDTAVETSAVNDSFGLSPREREVLCLLAAGRSNQEIADALFISRRTVTTHVTHILTKLGVDSRAAAAGLAVRHGLA